MVAPSLEMVTCRKGAGAHGERSGPPTRQGAGERGCGGRDLLPVINQFVHATGSKGRLHRVRHSLWIADHIFEFCVRFGSAAGKQKRRRRAHLAGVDVGHELCLALRCVSAFPKENDARLEMRPTKKHGHRVGRDPRQTQVRNLPKVE